MSNFSSSKIEDNVIVFSSRDVNAWNASIKSGSTIVLGGSHGTLQDILRYRLDIAHKDKGVIKPGSEEIHTQAVSTTDGFEVVAGGDAVKLAKVPSTLPLFSPVN